MNHVYVGRRPYRAGTPITELSPRYRKTARLAALGYTVNEIGAILKIPPSTIKNYLHHMYKLANVNNRVKFARWCWEQELSDAT